MTCGTWAGSAAKQHWGGQEEHWEGGEQGRGEVQQHEQLTSAGQHSKFPRGEGTSSLKERTGVQCGPQQWGGSSLGHPKKSPGRHPYQSLHAPCTASTQTRGLAGPPGSAGSQPQGCWGPGCPHSPNLGHSPGWRARQASAGAPAAPVHPALLEAASSPLPISISSPHLSFPAGGETRSASEAAAGSGLGVWTQRQRLALGRGWRPVCWGGGVS